LKIGILVHYNGEYDAYVGFFADPDKLLAVVDKLKKERRDEFGEIPDIRADTLVLDELDGPITNDMLDGIADIASDAGVEIERTEEWLERIRREAEEAGEAAPLVPSPGQISMEEPAMSEPTPDRPYLGFTFEMTQAQLDIKLAEARADERKRIADLIDEVGLDTDRDREIVRLALLERSADQ
jgi:hypothetical protein